MKKIIAAMALVMLDVTLNSAAAESISRSSTAPWSGLYMGVGIGGKWANSDWTTNCFGSACSSGGDNPFFVDASSPRPFDVSMFHGTVYGGFNWQLGHWIVGVEGDLGSGSKSKITRGIPGCTTDCGNLPPTPDDIDSASIRMVWDGSVRGRAGFLLASNILVFGTAGLAFQRIDANLTCSFPGPWCFPAVATDIRSQSHGSTLRGLTVGGGLEWMVHGNWLVRGEYRYSDFGRFDSTFFNGTGDDVFTSIHVVTQVVTFGVGYKF